MKRGLIVLLVGYQKTISPWLPPACRFHPSCSQYAIEAIRQYGYRKGFRRAIGRLLRCHPFHPGGHDPVKK
ncbi:MAG TPA: membrane protein insertion efficiency factor YidD [Nitrospiria bacterium]|nr:membrane protein insertion efficiency factor YidD [Nitrospiria bacterium]